MPTNRRLRRSRPEAGFTLIEALIAMVVLITGLTAVANLLLVAASTNGVASTMSATTAEASEVMDLLKAIPWSNLTPGGSLTADLPGQNTSDPRVITNAAGVLTQYNSYHTVPGVGRIRTRWTIVAVAATPNQAAARFITVTADAVNRLARGKSAATFTTFRTCTGGPPAAGPPPVCM
jgi:type II secretory pathway pseudopilin PulG